MAETTARGSGRLLRFVVATFLASSSALLCLLVPTWAEAMGPLASAAPTRVGPVAPPVDLTGLPAALAADAQGNALAKLLATEAALRHAGFDTAQVLPNEQGNDVGIVVTPSAHGPGPSTAADVAARVVWTTFADSFDRELVMVSDQPLRTYEHAQLLAVFGPRPRGFDQDPTANDLLKSLAAAGVLLLDAIALVVVLVRIVRRAAGQLGRVRQAWWLSLPNAEARAAAGTLALYAIGIAALLWFGVRALGTA